jgi:hypothetical protein
MYTVPNKRVRSPFLESRKFKTIRALFCVWLQFIPTVKLGLTLPFVPF